MKIYVVKGRKKNTEIILDDEDYDRVDKSRYSWSVGNGQVRRYVQVPLASFLLNAPEDMMVDHINGNPLDNRKENLRICTHAENMFNRKLNKNNKSGYKGVSKEIRGKQIYWRTTVIANRKKYSRYFKVKGDAARWYNEMAEKLHGDFARPNIIKDEDK